MPLRVTSWKLPPPDRPVDASYRLVCSLTSSSVSGAGEMLSVSEPSFDVRFVASMPLKNRLVLVVRVPLTDGEMLPVPLMSTGGRSALTPASDDSRCVKLPVDVGMISSSAPVRLRDVVDGRHRRAARRRRPPERSRRDRRPPASPAADRVTAASTITPLRTSFLNPSSSNVRS